MIHLSEASVLWFCDDNELFFWSVPGCGHLEPHRQVESIREGVKMLSIELLFAFIMSLAFWRCDTEQVIYTDQYELYLYKV